MRKNDCDKTTAKKQLRENEHRSNRGLEIASGFGRRLICRVL